jgi:PAS domain S-box-containing protein
MLQPLCLYAYLTEVSMSEGQRNSETPAHSEELFRLMVEAVRDYAIFALDTEGHVMSWNPGAERIKGYSAQDIIGSHFSRFYTDEDLQSGKPKMELRVAIKEGKYEEEGWRVRKDGSLFWANVLITAIRDKTGTLRGFAKVTRDLTERRAAENRVLQLNAELEQKVKERTAQLEAANKELEAFSYSVSHDLRAPLRGIDGFSQALLEDYADRLEPQGQDYLLRIRAATQRMAGLIDDLLNLSRITRGELRREMVDLSALARSIADQLRKIAPERQVKFNLADNLKTEGDPHLLRIALENLLGNAWKFTGKITDAEIEFGLVAVGSGEDHPTYFVRDNGAGFDMAYADKLFGAFQRLHDVREFEGTGIGLATVQRIIRRHGGRVWAEAEPGRGATFYFTL